MDFSRIKGNDDAPRYPSNATVGVGVSDTTLVFVSVVGLSLLVGSVAIRVWRRTTPSASAALEKEEWRRHASSTLEEYEAHLMKCPDVSKLNRTQRRLRAHALMKQQRRAVAAAADNGAPEMNENNRQHPAIRPDPRQVPPPAEELIENRRGHAASDQLRFRSRKERQKEARATEKEERRLFDTERREHQRRAQKIAQKEKWERSQRQRLLLEDARHRDQAARTQKVHDTETRHRMFLATPRRTQTVEEWQNELQLQNRPVIISIHQVAESFGVPPALVQARIQTLLDERRIGGVLEDSGHFFYLTDDQLHEIAKQVVARAAVSLCDVASICNNVMGPV